MEPTYDNIRSQVEADNSPRNTEVCSRLNAVTAKAINSVEILLDAAQAAESETLHRSLMDWKADRDLMVTDLQHIVVRLGGDPATKENFTGWLHRKWTDVRLAIEPGKDFVIADELSREEESMGEAVGVALMHDALPADAKAILLLEQNRSAAIRDLMKTLKPAVEPEDYVDVNRHREM